MGKAPPCGSHEEEWMSSVNSLGLASWHTFGRLRSMEAVPRCPAPDPGVIRVGTQWPKGKGLVEEGVGYRPWVGGFACEESL